MVIYVQMALAFMAGYLACAAVERGEDGLMGGCLTALAMAVLTGFLA